jgi:hypothetical protein
MALGWITVLKLVPWGDVIKNAPVIADGAKKLWDTVGGKPRAAEGASAPGSELAAAQSARADPDVVTSMQARLAEAEASIAQLNEQMQASSALIKALAEQNAELIQRIEINRVRTLWVVALLLVIGAIAGLNLAVTLSGNG